MGLIKLDGSLVVGIEHERSNSTIVSATVYLARVLGPEVVAEGIRTAGGADRPRAFERDLGQDDYRSPACSVDSTTAILAADRVR